MSGKIKTLENGIPIFRWDCKDHQIKYFDSATKDGDRPIIFADDLKEAMTELRDSFDDLESDWDTSIEPLAKYVPTEGGDTHALQKLITDIFCLKEAD